MLCEMIYPFHRFGRSFKWGEFCIVYGVLLIGWLAYGIVEATLKTVEVELVENKVSFIIQKQFRADVTIDLQLSSLTMSTTIQPSRNRPKNIILTIKDDTNYVMISSRQKGLSEAILQQIEEKLANVQKNLKGR